MIYQNIKIYVADLPGRGDKYHSYYDQYQFHYFYADCFYYILSRLVFVGFEARRLPGDCPCVCVCMYVCMYVCMGPRGGIGPGAAEGRGSFGAELHNNNHRKNKKKKKNDNNNNNSNNNHIIKLIRMIIILIKIYLIIGGIQVGAQQRGVQRFVVVSLCYRNTSGSVKLAVHVY